LIEKTKNILRRLQPTSVFARGVSLLVGSTAGAQILLVLAAPILTRLYTPEEFGLLAVYGSMLAIIGVVASLHYELAIPLPVDDLEAADLVALCLTLVIAMSLLTGAAIYFWRSAIAELLGVPRLANYLWLLPLGVLLTGFYTVFNYWGIRAKRFADIASTKLNQAIATLVIQLGGFKLGGIALLLGQVAGQSVGTTSLAIQSLKRAEFKQVSLSKIKAAFFRYKEFPLYTTWSSLVNTAGHQLPPLIFVTFFSEGAAGIYALANRLLTMPATLLGGALAQVFFSHGVDSHRSGTLNILYAKVQNALIQLGLPPSILLILVGPELFSFLFGVEWRDAGVISQWLAVGAFFGFVVSPLSHIFTILEMQRLGLMLQLFLLLARSVGIFIGVFQGDIISAVMYYSIGSAIGYAGYLFYGARVAGCRLAQFIESVLHGIVKAVVVIGPILIGYYSGLQWLTISLSIVSLVIYASQCLRLARDHL
jgi:O-antigen/teichoic acid export membrane protein